MEPYQGDMSEWGRKTLDLKKKAASESDWTLSSGLSPRDSLKHAEFDVAAAKHTLAYNAGGLCPDIQL